MKTKVHPKLRVMVFVILVNALGCGAVWLCFDRPTWLWFVPIALSINTLLLTYDQVLHFSRFTYEPLLGQDPWGLLKLVHQLSEKFQLRPPRVFIVPHPSAQIFCYGKTKGSVRLFVTEGTLKLLNSAELTAALTYQMCVMNSSMSVLNYWLGACLDLCLRSGRALERIIAFIFGWSPKLSAALVSPCLWLLQHTLLNTRDFRQLDREAAARCEQPETLALALWKMEAYARTQPWVDAWVFAPMCMVSPLRDNGALGWLRVQPSLKSRIKELTGHYPL